MNLMDPKGFKNGSFFPKGLDRLACLKWKTESEILSKYIVLARKQLLFIYRSWMLSIYIYRFYFGKWNYRLKTIYKSPLFVYNSSTKTWITIACPVLKLSFSCRYCNICSNRKLKVTGSCLSIWMSLDKVGNNFWYSQRICFCRFGKLNVAASWVCHWEQYSTCFVWNLGLGAGWCVSLCPVCREKCEDSKIPTLLLYLNLSIYCITEEGWRLLNA